MRSRIACAIDYLKGVRATRGCTRSCIALGAEMLMLGKLASSRARSRENSNARWRAARRRAFARMVAGLGGPADLLERAARHLAQAPVLSKRARDRAGFVTAIDVRALGLAVVALGGGRRRAGDAIDPCRRPVRSRAARRRDVDRTARAHSRARRGERGCGGRRPCGAPIAIGDERAACALGRMADRIEHRLRLIISDAAANAA